jgi:hypothetical protein
VRWDVAATGQEAGMAEWQIRPFLISKFNEWFAEFQHFDPEPVTSGLFGTVSEGRMIAGISPDHILRRSISSGLGFSPVIGSEVCVDTDLGRVDR